MIPKSISGRILIGLLLAGGIGFGIERLIVTDREAVEATIEQSLLAARQEDVSRLLELIHDDFMAESMGDDFQDGPEGMDPAKKKKRLKKGFRKLFSRYEIKRVEVLDQQLSLSNGQATAELSVFIQLDPDKSKGSIQTNRLKIDVVVTFQKQEERWKIYSVKRQE